MIDILAAASGVLTVMMLCVWTFSRRNSCLKMYQLWLMAVIIMIGAGRGLHWIGERNGDIGLIRFERQYSDVTVPPILFSCLLFMLGYLRHVYVLHHATD